MRGGKIKVREAGTSEDIQGRRVLLKGCVRQQKDIGTSVAHLPYSPMSL